MKSSSIYPHNLPVILWSSNIYITSELYFECVCVCVCVCVCMLYLCVSM